MSKDEATKRAQHNAREMQRARKLAETFSDLKVVLEAQGRSMSRGDKLVVLQCAVQQLQLLYSAMTPDQLARLKAQCTAADGPTGFHANEEQNPYAEPAVVGQWSSTLSKGSSTASRSPSGSSSASAQASAAAGGGQASKRAQAPAATGPAAPAAPAPAAGASKAKRSRVATEQERSASAAGTAGDDAVSRAASPPEPSPAPSPTPSASASPAPAPAPVRPKPTSPAETLVPSGFYNHLFERTELAQCILDKSFMVLAVNDQFAKMLGFDPTYPRGVPASSLTPFLNVAAEGDMEGLSLALSQVFAGVNGQRSMFLSCRILTGGYHEASHVVIAHIDGRGQFPDVIHVTLSPSIAPRRVQELAVVARLHASPPSSALGTHAPGSGHSHGSASMPYRTGGTAPVQLASTVSSSAASSPVHNSHGSGGFLGYGAPGSGGSTGHAGPHEQGGIPGDPRLEARGPAGYSVSLQPVSMVGRVPSPPGMPMAGAGMQAGPGSAFQPIPGSGPSIHHLHPSDPRLAPSEVMSLMAKAHVAYAAGQGFLPTPGHPMHQAGPGQRHLSPAEYAQGHRGNNATPPTAAQW